jgi:hypothetical protein
VVVVVHLDQVVGLDRKDRLDRKAMLVILVRQAQADQAEPVVVQAQADQVELQVVQVLQLRYLVPQTT